MYSAHVPADKPFSRAMSEVPCGGPITAHDAKPLGGRTPECQMWVRKVQTLASSVRFFGLEFYGGRILGTFYLHFCGVHYRPCGESRPENRTELL